MGAGEGFDWAETWRMSGTYCRQEKGVRGEGYFAPIFESLQELLVSCYMKSSFPSQGSRRLASWAAFITCHSPSHTCAPAKLYCTALPCLCALPHALPGNWNVNFWDWLLVKTSGSLRLCSKSTLSLRFCCSPQPIHLSSSVSLSPVTTSHQELVTLCICAHTLSPKTAWWEDPGLLSAADKSHCALLSARGSTEGANKWYSNMWANSTQGHTLYDFFVGNENGIWHGGPGNMKASFGNRLLGFKPQLHYILPVWP